MNSRHTTACFWVTLIATVILFFAGILCPPMGEISPSVLTAGSILGGFALIGQIPAFIEACRNGQSFEVKKGDITIRTTGKQEHEEITE